MSPRPARQKEGPFAAARRGGLSLGFGFGSLNGAGFWPRTHPQSFFFSSRARPRFPFLHSLRSKR